MSEQKLLEDIKNFQDLKNSSERSLVELYKESEGINQIATQIQIELEKCEYISWDEGGFIESVIELPGDAKALNEYQREALEEIGMFNIVGDHASHIIDTQDESIIYDERERKFYYNREEYETKEEALEAAEKDGLYPSVYRQGYYGDLTFYK